MDPEDRACPIRLQGIPSNLELEDQTVETDPETVLYNSPAPLITRLYPDRLIINVTNACTMFCRHCLRRRHIAHENLLYSTADVELALQYVREHPEIRDVLITGGDSFCLPDRRLDQILTSLDEIEHVEIKRLGTRTLAVLPQRITDDLCEMLSRHGPLYLNTQFNHSKEVSAEAQEAADKLTRAGVVLGNQAVLLKGINADRHVMKKLMQDCLRIKVRPYLPLLHFFQDGVRRADVHWHVGEPFQGGLHLGAHHGVLVQHRLGVLVAPLGLGQQQLPGQFAHALVERLVVDGEALALGVVQHGALVE